MTRPVRVGMICKLKAYQMARIEETALAPNYAVPTKISHQPAEVFTLHAFKILNHSKSCQHESRTQKIARMNCFMRAKVVTPENAR